MDSLLESLDACFALVRNHPNYMGESGMFLPTREQLLALQKEFVKSRKVSVEFVMGADVFFEGVTDTSTDLDSWGHKVVWGREILCSQYAEFSRIRSDFVKRVYTLLQRGLKVTKDGVHYVSVVMWDIPVELVLGTRNDGFEFFVGISSYGGEFPLDDAAMDAAKRWVEVFFASLVGKSVVSGDWYKPMGSLMGLGFSCVLAKSFVVGIPTE